MDTATFDREMMVNAVAMARRGLGQTAPNPSVGAIIADETAGEIIARGWTQPGGRPHAETDALRRAETRSRGATLYVTLEPCSHHGQTGPCADAIIASGLKRVVVAIEDPDPRVSGRGIAKLRAAGIDVATGVLADEARWVTLGHILRVTEQRPFIQLKLALNAAGHIVRGANGKPAWVTGPDARAHGHLLRAEADAILVGVDTVIADDPELTCRLPGLQSRSPQRIIADTLLRTPLDSKLVRSATRGADLLIATALSSEAARASALLQAGVTLMGGLATEPAGQRIDLQALAAQLAGRGMTRLLVEGGPAMWRSFADQGLADEVILFMANAAPSSSPSPRVGGERSDEEQCALAALAAHLGDLPLHVTEHRNLGPDTLWRMMVRRAD